MSSYEQKTVGYKKRRSNRRSNNGFGSAVADTIGIANAFGPRGTLIAGVVGFSMFYFLVPWALMAWVDHSKAQMVSQNAGVYAKLLDDIFIRRFIHPSEWAGVAILVGCILLACWKTFTRKNLGRHNEQELSGIAKLLARFLD